MQYKARTGSLTAPQYPRRVDSGRRPGARSGAGCISVEQQKQARKAERRQSPAAGRPRTGLGGGGRVGTMTTHGEGGAMHKFSSDPRRRMSDYQTMAVNARMRIFAVLAAAGLEPDDADELICSVEAGSACRARRRIDGAGVQRAGATAAEDERRRHRGDDPGSGVCVPLVACWRSPRPHPLRCTARWKTGHGPVSTPSVPRCRYLLREALR